MGLWQWWKELTTLNTRIVDSTLVFLGMTVWEPDFQFLCQILLPKEEGSSERYAVLLLPGQEPIGDFRAVEERLDLWGSIGTRFLEDFGITLVESTPADFLSGFTVA